MKMKQMYRIKGFPLGGGSCRRQVVRGSRKAALFLNYSLFNGNKLPTPHPSTTLTPSPKGEGLSLVFAHFVAVKNILTPHKP